MPNSRLLQFFLLLFLFSTLVQAHSPQHGHQHVGVEHLTIFIDGQPVELEVKTLPFDMDNDVNLKNALKKLGEKIHESLEDGDHHSRGLKAVAQHFVSALDIKSMATNATRFVNASNRSERWREHIKNLVFLSFLTHGYEVSSSFVNYYAAKSMGAGDAAALGAAAVGVVMAVPGLVDFVCWGGYLGYATLPPFRGLIQVMRTVTVRVSRGTAQLIGLDRLKKGIMDVISAPELAPQIRARGMNLVGRLTHEKLESGRTRLAYEEPTYGTIKLETEAGVDTKNYVRRLIISEGIANQWLNSNGSRDVLNDSTYFREQLLREFKVYGFNVAGLLKETLSAISQNEVSELIHKFYVEGIGQTAQKMVVVDLIPDAVHISRARIIRPWESAKEYARKLSCRSALE